jgi:hypothetical protein
VGDSYVNGFQVDPEENFGSVLRGLLGGELEVYRFGMPGAPLSQYLHMSRWASRLFAPDVLVFTVVHNDFYDSVRELRAEPSFLQLSRRDGGFVEVPPTAPSDGPPAWRWSATLRYLHLTLQSSLLVGRPDGEANRYTANIPVDQVREAGELIRAATFWIVRRAREENPGRTVIFVMDAPRADLYAGRLDASGVRWLNELVAEACRESGVAFVDLTHRFGRIFARDGTRFESDVDSHWNEAGHREVAQALLHELRRLGVAGAKRPAGPARAGGRAVDPVARPASRPGAGPAARSGPPPR